MPVEAKKDLVEPLPFLLAEGMSRPGVCLNGRDVEARLTNLAGNGCRFFALIDVGERLLDGLEDIFHTAELLQNGYRRCRPLGRCSPAAGR